MHNNGTDGSLSHNKQEDAYPADSSTLADEVRAKCCRCQQKHERCCNGLCTEARLQLELLAALIGSDAFKKSEGVLLSLRTSDNAELIDDAINKIHGLFEYQFAAGPKPLPRDWKKHIDGAVERIRHYWEVLR